jgi:DNA-binding CsgD family transcriptional regulator
MSLDLELASPCGNPTSSWNLLAPPHRAPSPIDGPRPTGLHPIWQVAVAAEERASECRLGDIWQDHVGGRLRAWWESVGPDRVLLVSRMDAKNRGCLDAGDTNLVARVLSGDQQKCVASDLGLAPSTVSGRFIRALDRLDLARATVPLPLILAAQVWVGVGEIARARSAVFTSQGHVCVVVSVPRPVTSHIANLTTSERMIAQWVIEGHARPDIARHRETSINTVSRQFHAIHSALHLTGRYALIRRALELQCFR